MRILRPLPLMAACLILAACNSNSASGDGAASSPEDQETESPQPAATTSILRPDIEQPEEPIVPVKPLEETIGFSGGGSSLDASGLLVIQDVLASDQLKLGGPITLRGHSDAGGSDDMNQRISRERAEQVRDWLVKNGVAENRIQVIAFGEQNPVEPNAFPDGEPNEAGRAANRRVEVEIIPPKKGEGKSESAASVATPTDEAPKAE